MNDEIKIPTMKITPLKKICMTIGELPTSYLETMTYYEMLIWFTNYLRDSIIPAVNNNAEAVHELQILFVELQTYVNNYFDNLDIQDEINNKLDEMLEDGVLEQIIEQFLQLTSLICFDNVADMKLSQNLANGSYAKTLGYYNKNNGGGATYKIRTITNEDIVDEKTIIALSDNTLVAELICDNIINFEMFGAKGDGTTNDTTSIQTALNKNKKIIGIPNKTYLINETLTTTNDVNIDLMNSTIKSANGNIINISTGTSNVIIKNTQFDKVNIEDNINNSNNYEFENITMKDTIIHGIKLDYINKAYFNNCTFNNIGTNPTDINNQACGIRINHGNHVIVENSSFTYCHGTGACVIRNTKEMYVTNCIFDNNDYRGIVPADDETTGNENPFKTIGCFENNIIKNCGVNAQHHTGIGCNGIYSNCKGDISELVVRNNTITNVCENGIEGKFGIVEGNYVDGTGVDMVNHPTPSASGINMYGGIYRNNVVKNSYLAGLYVSGVHDSESTILTNKKIYNNDIGKCVSTPNEAIFVNGTEYNNIDIYDNKCDGSITIATNGLYKECVIGNNYNKSGKTYTNASSSVYLIDKGNILVDGFVINNSTITNIVLTRCSSTIRTNDVLFTATSDNGVIQFPTNCNKNSINCLKIMVNSHSSNSIKCTIMGTKDDNTTATIAYQKPVEVSNGIASLFVENDNTYKAITYQFIFGNTNDTIAISNFQVKEITN